MDDRACHASVAGRRGVFIASRTASTGTVANHARMEWIPMSRQRHGETLAASWRNWPECDPKSNTTPFIDAFGNRLAHAASAPHGGALICRPCNLCPGFLLYRLKDKSGSSRREQWRTYSTDRQAVQEMIHNQ